MDLPRIVPHAVPADPKRHQQIVAMAKRFEGLFLRELLKRAESPFGDGNPVSGREESPGMKQYRELFHDTLAERGAGDLGIAAMVVRTLERGQRTNPGGG